MENGEGFFGERVGGAVRARCPRTCSTPPSRVRRCDLLARLAGDERGARVRDRNRPDRRTAGRTRHHSRRHGQLARRCSPSCARSPAPTACNAVVGDMATTRCDGEFTVVFLVFNTIFDLTHAGRPGRLLRECLRAPAARRAVRDRGARAGAAEAPTRPDDRRRPGPSRSGSPDYVYDVVTPAASRPSTATRDDGTVDASSPCRGAVCVASRAGPDGAARGHAARAPLGRLAGSSRSQRGARRMCRCT